MNDELDADAGKALFRAIKVQGSENQDSNLKNQASSIKAH